MDLNMSPGKRLKVVVTMFTLLEVVEVVRVLCVTEWLLTTRWDKTVIIELVFLALLLVTNLLLYLGTVRRSPVELLAWLVSHLVFLCVQIILLVYLIVVLFIIASPHTQNAWLGLPRGMASNTSEFQQELRYNLGVTLTKLVVLIITVPVTVMALKIVWREKQRMEEEQSAGQAKYEIKAEYRAGELDRTQGGSVRRDSHGHSMVRDHSRRSSQRSYSDSVYTVPASQQTEQTFLQGGPVPGPYRGAPSQDPALLWSRQTSRQTSLDTSYNVPSIRSEMAETRQLGRFDSIAEVTESMTPSVRR